VPRHQRAAGEHPPHQYFGQQERGGEVVGDSFQLLLGVGALVGPVQQRLVALAVVVAGFVEQGEVLPAGVRRGLVDDAVVGGDGQPVAPAAKPAARAGISGLNPQAELLDDRALGVGGERRPDARGQLADQLLGPAAGGARGGHQPGSSRIE
jgi:hypothetical protein